MAAFMQGSAVSAAHQTLCTVHSGLFVTGTLRNMHLTLSFAALLTYAHATGVLKPGTPESVGLIPQPLLEMERNVSGYTKPGNHGSFSNYVKRSIEPGSATLFAHKGIIVSSFAVGKRILYANVNGMFLPKKEQEEATIDTIYDMASLTKMFTTIAAMRELDSGHLALDRTVASYMPAFTENGKTKVTILQLLTHTSGFNAEPKPPLYSPDYNSHEERVEAILKSSLLNASGSKYLCSDLNFLTLRLLLEHVTKRPLDTLIGSFTSALGMTSTFFNRGNKEDPEFSFYHRMATQEYQLAAQGTTEPARPQPVRGTVHDENAWAFGWGSWSCWSLLHRWRHRKALPHDLEQRYLRRAPNSQARDSGFDFHKLQHQAQWQRARTWL